MTRLVVFTTHPIQYQAPWFRALAAADGLDIEVVFSYLPDADEQGVGFDTAFEWDIPLLTGYRYRVLAATALPRSLPGFAQRWTRGIASMLSEIKPDVAMILGWQELSLVRALIACRRCGIPIVLRGESNALKPRLGLVAMLHRCYFNRCDAFLAIGKANADFYHSAGVPNTRIVTAGYFVDNERFKVAAESLQGDRTALRRFWSIDDDVTCFIFVGKLEPKKCVMDYLAALRLAHERGVKVVGLVVGSGIKDKEARRFVNEHALPVTFAGFLNQSEIARAYVVADALVLPSDYGETWGLAVNEAMATGIPAIVSDRVGAANDLVIDRETGLVVPYGNVVSLAEAMIHLATDHDARRRMGREGQLHVMANYSVAHAVARTREITDLVLERHYAAA